MKISLVPYFKWLGGGGGGSVTSGPITIDMLYGFDKELLRKPLFVFELSEMTDLNVLLWTRFYCQNHFFF